jgi:DNA-directed RNA polymerase specialized sigma24 family protein
MLLEDRMNIYENEGGIHDLLTLREAVSKLPDKLRAVVALRSSGYTQKECGEILGVTRAAIGFAQKRAILKLRRLIEDEQRIG